MVNKNAAPAISPGLILRRGRCGISRPALEEVIFIVDQEKEKWELRNLDPLRRVLVRVVGIEKDVLMVREIEDGPGKIPFAFASPIDGFRVQAQVGGHESRVAVAPDEILVVPEFRIGASGILALVLIEKVRRRISYVF